LEDDTNALLKIVNTGHDMFWLSCVHALLGEKETGLEYLRELVKNGARYYINQARSEEDWRMFHKDEDFLAICNSL
jgi:hypothetical protein